MADTADDHPRTGHGDDEMHWGISYLREDIQDLRAMIVRLEARFDDRLDRQDAKFGDRLNHLEAKFDDRFNKQDAKFESGSTSRTRSSTRSIGSSASRAGNSRNAWLCSLA